MRCASILTVFTLLLGLALPLWAEPRDIVIVEGDVTKLPSVNDPGRVWLDYRIRQLRGKGYNVHVVREVELGTMRELVTSPSTAGVIFYGHSSSTLVGGTRGLPIYHGGRVGLVTADTQTLMQLAFGDPPPADPAKKIFVYSCHGNQCTATYDALRIAREQVTSVDGPIWSILRRGNLEYDDFEESLNSKGEVGKWMEALPAYRGNGASVDWAARNQWHRENFWPSVIKRLKEKPDVSLDDVRAALHGGPSDPAITNQILEVGFRLVKDQAGYERLFEIARAAGIGGWFLYNDLERYLSYLPPDKQPENVMRLLALLAKHEDAPFVGIVEKMLLKARNREEVMAYFDERALHYVDRSRYELLGRMIRRIQRPLSQKGVSDEDFRRVSQWLEARDRETCGYRHLVFRNFRGRNALPLIR